MVKPVPHVSEKLTNKSSINNITSSIMFDPEDRIKNADRLAKSLKSYLDTNPIGKRKTQGKPRDPRICQLNAAYKYIIHLEDNIKNICNIHNHKLTEDCHLVHLNARLNNSSYRHRLENSDMTPTTPSERTNLIHESSTISGTASSSSPTSSLESNSNSKKPMCSTSQPLRSLRNFENVDASPILGNENHFFGEIENFDEFETNIRSRKSPASNPRKRKLITSDSAETDINNNHLFNQNINKENQKPSQITSFKSSVPSTPKNEPLNQNLQTPDNRDQNLDPDMVNGRKHYFLRSTNRLKNMLIANNPVAKSTPVNRKRTPAIKKNQLHSRMLDSSISSTRSTSTATTPSVPNSNMSTNSSNEFDNIDSKHLIKLNLSQEQVAQLYESNQRDNGNSKNSLNFV